MELDRIGCLYNQYLYVYQSLYISININILYGYIFLWTIYLSVTLSFVFLLSSHKRNRHVVEQIRKLVCTIWRIWSNFSQYDTWPYAMSNDVWISFLPQNEKKKYNCCVWDFCDPRITSWFHNFEIIRIIEKSVTKSQIKYGVCRFKYQTSWH